MAPKRKVEKNAEPPAKSGRVSRSAAGVTRSAAGVTPSAAKSSSVANFVESPNTTRKSPVEGKKSEGEGKVKEEGEASRAVTEDPEADTEDPVAVDDGAMTIVVVEHCNQSNLFKDRAIEVKEGLESSECAVVVKLNPKQPRRGCFEIRLLAEDKTFFSLLDMKSPFQPLKKVRIYEVIANIINKLKKAMVIPWSKDQMHALLSSLVYNKVFPKTASDSDWKNIRNDPRWPILRPMSWKVLKFKSLHLVRQSEMWKMREINEIVAAMVTHEVLPDNDNKDDWLSMRFDPQFSILRVRPWKVLRDIVRNVLLQWDASGAVKVDPEAEEDAVFTIIVVEHCTQCDLFKTKAIQVKEALESSDCAVSVWLNPEMLSPSEPRRGCFEIRYFTDDMTFISLLDMKPPFQPLKNLDMDKVIRDIINKIRSVMEMPWPEDGMLALLTGLVVHKVFPEHAEESDWQKIRNDPKFSILRPKSWKDLKFKSLHLVHYKQMWQMPLINEIVAAMITHGVMPTSEEKDDWLSMKFDPEFSSLTDISWKVLRGIVQRILVRCYDGEDY